MPRSTLLLDTCCPRRLPCRGLLPAATLTAFLLPLAPAAADESPVLARVGDAVITVAELESEAARLGLGRANRSDGREARRALLDELVRRKAVEVAARREGYAEHPDVQRVLAEAMAAKYLQDRLEQALAETRVTDEVVESHYRAHAERYTVPQRARGAVILIEVPDDAGAERLAALEAEARSVRASAAEADDRQFAALAREHSADRASRYRGGEIGWVQRAGRPLKWGDAVVDALLALERPGDVGPVVRGPEGFYVLRLLERAEPRLRPLDTLRAGIRHQLTKERRDALREEFYTRLASTIEIEIDREALEAIEMPGTRAQELRPPELPSGTTGGVAGPAPGAAREEDPR